MTLPAPVQFVLDVLDALSTLGATPPGIAPGDDGASSVLSWAGTDYYAEITVFPDRCGWWAKGPGTADVAPEFDYASGAGTAEEAVAASVPWLRRFGVLPPETPVSELSPSESS